MLLIPHYIIKFHDFSSLVSNLFQLKMISCCLLHSSFPLHRQSLVNHVLLSLWSNADKVRAGETIFPWQNWVISLLKRLVSGHPEVGCHPFRWAVGGTKWFGLVTNLLKDIEGWHIHMMPHMCDGNLKQSVSHVPFLWVKVSPGPMLLIIKVFSEPEKKPSGRND